MTEISSYLQQSTRTYLSVFPAPDGRGKWHAALTITGLNYCHGRNSVLLDTAAAPLIVNIDAAAHPIACKSCVAMWRVDVRERGRA